MTKAKHRILFVCHGNICRWYTVNFEATWRDVLEECQALLDRFAR